ncbi:Two-component transcriptional response regulator, LuxR family [hydrothermal vent metagenome]|uniref:Two-component transcriptional response regulator, LuxR family n=1 Tax=hydrothermal vent metagenome TaxID=652676 RepID=A0A3B1BFN9_9ZZZZ
MNTEVKVFIVDDDESIRHSLRWLLESVKLQVSTFSSAENFLQNVDTDHAGCLILDVRMPGMNGMELQQALIARTSTLPIIILTGHGDVPMAVRAMSEGAFDFVQKPFNGPQLLNRVELAIAHSKKLLKEKYRRTELQSRYTLLTPRERQVMEFIIAGNANKVIAIEMDIGQRTVEVHRHRVMEKMQAHSVAELIHFNLQL